MRKSQTATEYLIILAVVIVVALVVINTMGGFPGIGSSSGKKVSDLKLNNDVVGVSGFVIGTNSSVFNLKNNNYDTVTVTEFRINQQANLTCNSSNTVPSLPIVLNIGQSVVVNCSAVNSTNYVLTDKQTPVVGILYSDTLGAIRTAGNVLSYNSTNLSGAQSLSSNKSIISFNITSPVSAIGIINETNRSILISVPFGTAVNAMNTSITFSNNATINLSSGLVVDFTNPVNYTVTAQDGSTQIYTITVNVALNSAKAITAFSFASPSATGVVTESNHTISINVSFGTNRTSLIPTITITGASVSPASGVASDFTSPVLYTVTAQDSSTQIYNVTVNTLPATGGAIISAVANGDQIYISTDLGNTWTAKGLVKNWTGICMSSNGTRQTAVGGGNTGAIPSEIYVSTDSGNTWVAKDSNRTWMSVAMSADGSKQSAVVYWGGFIYVSSDYGNTWTAKGLNKSWWGVALSSDGTQQLVGDGGAFSVQFYTSGDSGNNWVGKGTTGSRWSGVAMSANGSVQAVVSSSTSGFYMSTNSGSTWSLKNSSLKAYDIAMSSDGSRITTFIANGQLYVSNDSGNTWVAKESNRTWYSVAMSSDGSIQAATALNAQIYISTDYGNTWTPKGPVAKWYDVAMSK